jgi:hypothetical protein
MAGLRQALALATRRVPARSPGTTAKSSSTAEASQDLLRLRGPDEDVVRATPSSSGWHRVDGIYEIAGDVTPDDFPLT